MIRATAVVSLTLLLVLVLYLPSTHPPSDFIAHMRTEHAAAIGFWGEDAALRMLNRAVHMQDAATEVTPIPSLRDAPRNTGVNGAVAQEMGAVNQRFFNNPYFRSVDALLLLASYRLSTLLEWLPWLAPFILTCLGDGAAIRLVKSKEFRQHNPELFALYASLGIAVICASAVAIIFPITLSPLLLPTVPLTFCILSGLALACYHRIR